MTTVKHAPLILDIAGTTLFLASPAADYLNGVVLNVDGGWMGR